MLELNNVVVALDPHQEYQPALTKVLALARLAEFDITLISSEYAQHLVEGYDFQAMDLPVLREQYLEERKRVLEDLATPLRDNGLRVETRAIWGHPAHRVVVSEAIRQHADLVIAHTRRHSSLSRMILTPNDWQLVRACPMPLLLVKEQDWQATPQILAAVDPMHSRSKPEALDRKILTIATAFAALTGGKLHVLHSYNPVHLTSGQLERAARQHRSALRRLLDDFDIPAASQHLINEAPEYALSLMVQNIPVDIVVMGAISRNMAADIVLGSTTERVLDFLASDILVVKPDGFVSPVESAQPGE